MILWSNQASLWFVYRKGKVFHRKQRGLTYFQTTSSGTLSPAALVQTINSSLIIFFIWLYPCFFSFSLCQDITCYVSSERKYQSSQKFKGNLDIFFPWWIHESLSAAVWLILSPYLAWCHFPHHEDRPRYSHDALRYRQPNHLNTWTIEPKILIPLHAFMAITQKLQATLILFFLIRLGIDVGNEFIFNWQECLFLLPF